MKQRILTLSLIAITFLSACQKDTVAPTSKTTTTTATAVTSTPVLNSTAAVTPVVIPANITGYMRVQLALDSVNTNNILIMFKPGTSAAYVTNEDAVTLQGFGKVSLSSLSSDNIPLAINNLALTQKDVKIGLSVGAKASGTYKINMLAINSVPAVYKIYLKDNLAKDSLDMRANSTYAFNLKLADTSTYGNHRFSLVLHARS